MSINELQDEVVAEFSDFDDWMDRYQLLIDLGNEQEPLDEKYKTEQNLIEGCQSRVWLQADEVDGKIIFKAESDALIVKGIIALLIKVVSGHTPDEILNSELYFIDKIGLKDHLSPTRSNGLLSMVKQMRMYALAFKAKEAKAKSPDKDVSGLVFTTDHTDLHRYILLVISRLKSSCVNICVICGEL